MEDYLHLDFVPKVSRLDWSPGLRTHRVLASVSFKTSLPIEPNTPARKSQVPAYRSVFERPVQFRPGCVPVIGTLRATSGRREASRED